LGYFLFKLNPRQAHETLFPSILNPAILAVMKAWLEKQFHLTAYGTTVRTELIAGVTTFMTMAYILVVNPLILSDAGMDRGAVFTATALSSILAIVIMAFGANLPFALAPGMGLNAFFVYTVCLGMGHTWQFALTAVLLEGLIFIVLSFFHVREAILNSIPTNIKKAISVGIGLFIAFIGLVNAGIIVKPEAPALLVQLGNLRSPGPVLTMLGLLLTGALLARRIHGALLLGILAATVAGIPMGITRVPADGMTLVCLPPAPHLFAFELDQVFTLDMAVVLLTFLFVDMFDTVGTLIGVANKAGRLDANGRLPEAKPALLADAVGTVVGACLGTSTVTSYVESASGVAAGGRTGLTALATAGMFALALCFSPVFAMVPAAATAPALILVGLFMMSPIKEVELDDPTEAIPAFLTMVMMPLAYSIAEGILFGVIAYTALKALTGKFRDIHPVTWVLTLLFLAKAVMP